MTIMNVYSNAGVVNGQLLFGTVGPDPWVDLIWGYAYSLLVTNQTDNDIDTGTINIEGADAKPDNPCEPDVWAPIPPVQDCGPIVSGVPYGPEVSIVITADRPIKARSSCSYSIPCPNQFMRVTAAPPDTAVIAVLTRPRRSDYSHLGPYGGIPPPATLMSPFGATAPVAAQAAAAKTTAAPPTPRTAPPTPPPRRQSAAE